MRDDREQKIGALGVVGLLCAAIGIGLMFGSELGWLALGCALLSAAAAVGIWGR